MDLPSGCGRTGPCDGRRQRGIQAVAPCLRPTFGVQSCLATGRCGVSASALRQSNRIVDEAEAIAEVSASASRCLRRQHPEDEVAGHPCRRCRADGLRRGCRWQSSGQLEHAEVEDSFMALAQVERVVFHEDRAVIVCHIFKRRVSATSSSRPLHRSRTRRASRAGAKRGPAAA